MSESTSPANHWLWPAEGMGRTQKRRWLVATGLYLLLAFVSQWLLYFARDASAALKAVTALLPVIAIVQFLRLGVEFHRAQDELRRRIDAEAWVVSALVVGLVSFKAALVLFALRIPTISVAWLTMIAPALILGAWVAKRAISRRYG